MCYNATMKTLSIDHGTKKIGLAISDELGISAKALPLLKVSNFNQAVNMIKTFVEKEHCDQILLGLPSGYNNVDSPQTIIVRKFASLLSKIIGIPVILWDESYSSKQAEKYIKGKTKKNLDSEAAKLLLEEYLNSQDQ